MGVASGLSSKSFATLYGMNDCQMDGILPPYGFSDFFNERVEVGCGIRYWLFYTAPLLSFLYLIIIGRNTSSGGNSGSPVFSPGSALLMPIPMPLGFGIGVSCVVI